MPLSVRARLTRTSKGARAIVSSFPPADQDQTGGAEQAGQLQGQQGYRPGADDDDALSHLQGGVADQGKGIGDVFQ